jgi:very-short-patch-repair endonuclease
VGGVRHETLHSDGFRDAPDAVIAALAARQHGVVSLAQLLDAGLGRGAVDLRLRNGRLHRLHRGVYAVGHARILPRGRLWAAVLATGGTLSHRAAAAVWDLAPYPLGAIDVTSRRHRRSAPGLRVHRSACVETRFVDGLPVTTVGRTLLDLADVLDAHRLERLCHRAEVLRLLDLAAIPDLPGRRTRALRAALATLATGADVTRSEFEERFLAFVAARGLPRPRVNAIVLGYEVDFVWPEHRLVVETDGAATHLTARAFHADRERDAELLAGGYRVLRVTWRQLTREPDTLERRLRALLSGAMPTMS